jgi:hypothetical protein
VVEVDRSGQGVNIKGQLIAPEVLAHSSHWPNKVGGIVRFRGRDGVIVKRVIESIFHVGHDLALLRLSEKVDPENHFIARVAVAELGAPVTMMRHWGREPLGTVMREKADGFLFAWAKKDWIISGDSGGSWYQDQDEEVVLVGHSFRGGHGGRSPDYAKLLNVGLK